MEKWYKKSYFRSLVDMHIPGGNGNLENFDAEKYAECMKIAGVDTAYVYASNCLGLCLYPTDVGFRHSITAKRDIFGETVAALRKRGIGVVGYLNSWCTEGARVHPDWQIINSNGETSGGTSRYGTCCLNSPYRDMFHALVYEMVSKYDIDGLWVDMIGFFMPDCTCKWCRDKFRKETGLELPTTINWTDPAFLKYVNFKYDTVTSYTKGIADAAHRAKPHISTSFQCAGWTISLHNGMGDEYFELMDYVSGDFYSDKNKTDIVCRLLANLTQDSPFEYMVSRAPNLTYHTAIKDKSELLLQAYTSFLCGGSFLFIDAIDPDGSLNENLYRLMGDVKKEIEPFFKTIDHDAEILRDVAIYVNFASYTNRSSENLPTARMSDFPTIPDRLKLLNVALSRAHIDYDILTKKNINELSEYKVIIVPDLYRMSALECEKIREFVKNGGRLYISGAASALSTDGKNKDKFMLSDVMGVEYKEYVDRYPVYVAPTPDGQKYFEHFTPKYPAMLPCAVNTVEKTSDSATVLATITYPYTDARNYLRYSSAISNPPYEKTDIPAMVYNKFGKGACLYTCVPFEQSNVACNYDIVGSVIKSLADENGGLTLTCNECECLEHVVRYSPEKKHYTVSLLNYQNVKKIVTMHDVEFELALDIEPKRVYTNLGTDIKWEKCNGKLAFNLSKLAIYDVVYIELE